MKLNDITTYNVSEKYMGVVLGGYTIITTYVKANQLVAWFIEPIDFYIEEVDNILKIGKSKSDCLLFVRISNSEYYG